ncbi:MAG: FtsX-like permease family protein [Candidatus Kariarchaeaceae archaeon]|jgi:ABC-type lipoprotein release transport system permease subunit
MDVSSKSKKNFRKEIERSEYRNNNMRYFIIYLFLLNIYVLSIIFDVSYSYIPIIIPGVILLVFPLLFLLLARKSSTEKRFKGSKFDTLRLIKKYLIINRKYLLISIIGFAVPVMIISQTIIVNSVFDQQAIGDFVENTDPSALEIIYPIENAADLTNFKNNLQNPVEETLSNLDLEFKSLTSEISLEISMLIGEPYNQATLSANVWSNVLKQFITQFPSFNLTLSDSMNETLLILPSWIEEIGNYTDHIANGTFSTAFSGYNSTKHYLVSNNTEVAYDHYWIPQAVDFHYLNQFEVDVDLADIANILFENGGLLLPEESLWAINDDMIGFYESRDIYYDRQFTLCSSQVDIVFPNLEKISLDQLKSKLFLFESEMNSWLSGQSPPLGGEWWEQDSFFETSSPMLTSILDFEEGLGVTNEILLLIIGPLIGFGLVYVLFTIRLVEEKRKAIVAIMKNRWITNRQLQFLFGSEFLLTSIFSIVLGMAVSIPFTVYTLNSSNLIDTSLSSLPIPESWYWKIPLFGLLFSMNISITSYQRMITARYEDAEDTFERSDPVWQKYYIDVTLFAIGMGFWILESLQVSSSPNASVATTMLLVVIFSAPLILSRYFSSITSFILRPFLRISSGGLIKIASRNLIKHKFSIGQLVGLLLLGMMLTLATHVIPITYTDWGAEKNHYDLGADIYVDGIDSSNATIWGYFKNITGIDTYTEIARVTSVDEKSFEGEYRVLGVRPDNFSLAAYWDASYDDQELEEVIDKISTNTSIAMQEQALQSLGLSIGDSFSYQFGEQQSVSFDINGTFYLFPTLVTDLSESASAAAGDKEDYSDKGKNTAKYDDTFELPSEIPILAHIDMVREIGFLSGNLQVGAYVKLESGQNATQVAEAIKEVFSFNNSISVITIDDMASEFEESTTTKVIITVFQGMEIITILMILVAVIYFAFLSISQRQQEVGIYRSLGMIRRQFIWILSIEMLTIISIAMTSGVLFGNFVARRIIDIIISASPTGSLPPITMQIPWPFIGEIFSLVAGIGIIFTIISAIIITSKDAGNILRED